LIEGETYEVFKFNEGAAWMSGNILSLYEQYLHQLNQTINENPA